MLTTFKSFSSANEQFLYRMKKSTTKNKIYTPENNSRIDDLNAKLSRVNDRRLVLEESIKLSKEYIKELEKATETSKVSSKDIPGYNAHLMTILEQKDCLIKYQAEYSDIILKANNILFEIEKVNTDQSITAFSEKVDNQENEIKELKEIISALSSEPKSEPNPDDNLSDDEDCRNMLNSMAMD